MTRALSASLLLGLPFLFGCNSGGTGSGGKGTPIETLVENTERAMEEAKRAGADKVDAGDFENQKRKLDDARALIDDGKAEKARTRLRQAERGFKDLVKKAEDARKSLSAVLEEKKKTEDLITRAGKDGLDAEAREA